MKSLRLFPLLVTFLSALTFQVKAGTAFTYQGRITDGNVAPTGLYDIRFALHSTATGDNPVAPALTNIATGVTNGLFCIMIDCGAAFDGSPRWIELGLRTNGGAAFTTLLPRQQVTAAPSALYANNAEAAALAAYASTAGAVSADSVGNSALQNSAVTSAKIAPGQVVKSVNGLRDDVTLAPGSNVTITANSQTVTLASPSDWHTAGNASTVPGTDFIGTTDDQPLEFRVNNARVLRLESGSRGSSLSAGSNAVAYHPGTFVWADSQTGAYASTRSNQFLIRAEGGVGIGTPYPMGALDVRDATNAATGNIHVGGPTAGGAPKLIHFGDMQPNGVGYVYLGENGADDRLEFHAGRFYFDNGAVGIGTTNPATKLDVVGGVAASVFYGSAAGLTNLPSNSITGANIQDGTVTPADLSSAIGLWTRSNTNIGYDIGSVGIGTVFPSDAMLDVEGDIRLNRHDLFFREGTDRNHGLGWYGATKEFAGINIDGPVLYGWSGGGLGTTSTTNLALRWGNDGNVIVDPGNKNTGQLLPGLTFGNASGEGIASSRQPGTNRFGLDLFVGSVPRLSISNNGAVGIGTRSPQSALQVVGTVTATAFSGNGAVAWQPVSGTAQAAAPNSGYLLTNNQYVTVTLPSAPAVGDVVRVSGSGAYGWKLAQNAGQAVISEAFATQAGNLWTPGGTSRHWTSIDITADGWTIWAADGDQGNILYSTDGGSTWYISKSGGGWWVSIACSATGSRVIAADQGPSMSSGGQLWVYNGGTWTARETVRNWSSVACSADGARQIAAVYGGNLYLSSDVGATWTARASSANWSAVASSADGQKLVAAQFGGFIYTSANAGVSWTQRTFTSMYYASLACSDDGTRLVAAVSDGQIYTSTDSGVTWTARQVSRPWSGVATSADGSMIIATASTGNQIYLSKDGGISWVARDTSRNWSSVTSSADGTRLAATVNNGYVYTSVPTTTPGVNGYLDGSRFSAIELQYIGNNQFLPLSSSGRISVY